MAKLKTIIRDIIKKENAKDPETKEYFEKATSILREAFEGNFSYLDELIRKNVTARMLYKNAIISLIVVIREKDAIHLTAEEHKNKSDAAVKAAEERAEIAEKQVRNLDRELSIARHRIAELQSR